MKHLLSISATLLALSPIVAQAQIGVGTTTPDAKSALDIRAVDKGLLIPRLTAAQRTGITSPPQGLMVYQTDGTASGGPQTGFWYYAGAPALWVYLDPAVVGDNLGNHTATQNLQLGANQLVGNGGTIGLRLESDGDARLGTSLIWASTANDRLLKFGDGDNVTLGEASGDDLMQLRAKTFSFLPSPGTSYTGAVGLGVAAPVATLDVARGTATNGTAFFRGTVRGSFIHNGANEDIILRGGTLAGKITLNDTGGNVGIATSAPTATLDVARGTATDGTAIFRGTDRTSHFSYATTEDTYIRGGKATANVLLNDNGGNVGVGTTSPLSRLSISPNSTEAKITLWDNGNTTSHYGFGVSGAQLNYHVPGTGDTHVFYQGGKNGNGAELMRIQGNGTVGIGTSTPFATSRLYVQTRDLYGAYFVSVPNTALASTEAVHAEVFTTQNISSAVAVFGQAVSGASGQYGTGGLFRGSIGVQGESAGSGFETGGRFTGKTGVQALASSPDTDPAYGIYAQASGTGSGPKYAVYGFVGGGGGTKYAGYFDGNVYVAGNLGKAGGTFRIDHPQDPENKYLVHSFVESPEMLNIYRGHVTTDAQGRATATLPAYFEAENAGFEYVLTAVGQFAQVMVAEEVRGNQFIIATDKPNVRVSWQVTGARQDKWAQAHPINPEEPKAAAERGRYLLPELYGRPASEGIAAPPAPVAVSSVQTGTRNAPDAPPVGR